MHSLQHYKLAWEGYQNFLRKHEFSDDKFIEYFQSLGLQATYSQTEKVNPNYKGTWHICIRFSPQFKNTLQKKSSQYRYYGIKSSKDARLKLYAKCFKFIDMYLGNGTYFEKQRRM